MNSFSSASELNTGYFVCWTPISYFSLRLPNFNNANNIIKLTHKEQFRFQNAALLMETSAKYSCLLYMDTGNNGDIVYPFYKQQRIKYYPKNRYNVSQQRMSMHQRLYNKKYQNMSIRIYVWIPVCLFLFIVYFCSRTMFTDYLCQCTGFICLLFIGFYHLDIISKSTVGPARHDN